MEKATASVMEKGMATLVVEPHHFVRKGWLAANSRQTAVSRRR
jgi:hypothetical protein